MIKFKQGFVVDPKTGVAKDIIVKAAMPNKLKDILIGGSITLVGIAYLTYTAFRYGSEEFDIAEFAALTDAGLVAVKDDGTACIE